MINMKTYKQTFENLKNKKEGALIPFTVIGDPTYKKSLNISKKIIDAGADALELGLPFSDPIADGQTIQAADVRALNSGINTDKAFEFVEELRKYTEIPIGFLSYYNLIYQRGIKKFYVDSVQAGVNSVLIADMPIEEYYSVSKYTINEKIDNVFMVNQLTSDKKIKEIARITTGFVYAISRLGVTGVKPDMKNSTLSLIRRVKNATNKPLCVGFGISKSSHVKNIIKAGADGAIVGSAIASLIEKNIYNKERMLHNIYNYVKSMKNATRVL